MDTLGPSRRDRTRPVDTQGTTRRDGPPTTGTGAAPLTSVQDRRSRPLPVGYVPVLSLLVVVAALYGLLADDAYRLVPALTRETWRAQDAVTLATVPVLLWAAWRARAGSLVAHLLSTGILMWLAYGYAHLTVGAPFNSMFLVYLAVTTLAGFSLLDGLLRVDVVMTSPAFARAPRGAAALFLAVTGSGIAVLWLSEIVVALPDGLPTSTHLSELPNPTWVLDLGWLIPTALVAARMLRQYHPAGPVVAGAMLVMLTVLSVSMIAVVPFALAAGLGTDPAVRQQLILFAVLFAALGISEVWLLARARRRLEAVPGPWLRSGWWSDTGRATRASIAASDRSIPRPAGDR